MNQHLQQISADIQLIYSRIGDDISRRIFENRLLMTLTKVERDDNAIALLRERRNRDSRLAAFFEDIRKLDGDILIYGAGECGRYIYNSKFMEGIPVKGFIDNKEWNQGTVCSLPVYRFEDAVVNSRKAVVILSMESRASRRQIREQIAQTESDWNIIDVGGILRQIDKEAVLGIANPYYRYVYDLVDTNDTASGVLSRIMKAARPTACWITLQDGDEVGRLLKEKWGTYPWCCYLTDDKIQSEYNGIPVYTYEEAIRQYKELDIVIGTTHVSQKVKNQQATFGIVGECINLEEITEALNRQQYFDFFEYEGERETFVDGGVYDLGSVKEFLNWCGGNYEKIYAFEPEKSNYERCKEMAEQWRNVSLFNCGLLDRQGAVGFTSGLGGASRIQNQQQDFYSDYDIAVTNLDCVVNREKVTFIKMDIEGAEGRALLGAGRIITEQKPKLAICVYHKPEDIIEIPALVLRMRSDYQIAFRHYSLRDTETVMYAW